MDSITKTMTLYGAKWCAYCRTLQTYLDREGIEYDYKDVDDKSNEEAMLKQTEGKYLVPTVVIDGKAYQNPQPNQVKEMLKDE